MVRSLRPLVVISLVAAAATTAIVTLPDATAQSSAVPQAQAPQLVGGLPDFTQLVERVGPAVVNIEADVKPRRAMAQQMPDDEEIPEIFRRFFGPEGMPGVPRADPRGRGGVSMGTGFIISADGYVLTNHHVVEGSDEVKVKLSDRREFTAKVVGSDEKSDVALLKIAGNGLPFLRTGESNLLKPGQWVVAIGSPFGLDHSVTAGVVSAVGRSNPYADQQYVPFIQTDVAINRGNSGGPLLNTRGEVVGINSQIFSNSGGYMGVSFAIPIDVAMNAADQLKATGRVQRGQLGVRFQRDEISQEQARGFGLPNTQGALVNEIVPDGPADKAGIEVGDVIKSIDGLAIQQPSDLPPIVGRKAPGSKAKVTVFRNGSTRDIDVTLTQLDSAGPATQEAAPSGKNPRLKPSAATNALGLVGEDLEPGDRQKLGLNADEGVGVARVQGLAAREAGIRPGDLILRVGRQPVKNTRELNNLLANLKKDQVVMLLINRNGVSQYVAVTVRASDEDE